MGNNAEVYVDELIARARKVSDNKENGADEGIPDDDIVEWINDGQDHLQSLIINNYPEEFIAEKIIPIVSNQEAYDVPDQVFINNRFKLVEYSATGNLKDYYPLRPATLRERRTYTNTHPAYYIRRSGQILLSPIPTTTIGKIRVSYYRELDNLDLRRGTVASTANDGTSYTTITLTADDILDDTALATLTSAKGGNTICVTDSNGLSTYQNLSVASYSSPTITLSASQLLTGGTISAGDYVTIGSYTTCLTGLPRNCYRYLSEYAALRMMELDSSEDSKKQEMLLQQIESTILDSFADPSEDTFDFPVSDWDIMC